MGAVLVTATDFKPDGGHPSMSSGGSTPSRSRQIVKYNAVSHCDKKAPDGLYRRGLFVVRVFVPVL